MHIQRYCLLRYWLAQLLLPLSCFLLCVPLVLLAIWQQHQLQQQIQMVRLMHRPKQKIEYQPKQSTTFLYRQLKIIQTVFQRGFRVLRLTWEGNTLRVEADVVSPGVLILRWQQWKQQVPQVQLTSYDWLAGLHIKAQVRDAMAG